MNYFLICSTPLPNVKVEGLKVILDFGYYPFKNLKHSKF